MAKQIVYGEDARRPLLTGVDTIAQAVRTTLGPKGCNVAIGKKWGTPASPMTASRWPKRSR